MISPETKHQREQEEGRRHDLYRDSLGLWTIGVGHLVSDGRNVTEEQARAMLDQQGKPAPWSDEQIDAQLEADNAATMHAIQRAFPFVTSLPERVQAGIYDMAFQLGPSRCAGFKRMWVALQCRDYAGAQREALNSVWHQQTPARCERVAAMIGNE